MFVEKGQNMLSTGDKVLIHIKQDSIILQRTLNYVGKSRMREIQNC